jgi:hypothetical protein
MMLVQHNHLPLQVEINTGCPKRYKMAFAQSTFVFFAFGEQTVKSDRAIIYPYYLFIFGNP